MVRGKVVHSVRGEVRERLLGSARSLCAREGVGGTSIRRVIVDAGANLNAVHYHFGSREALIDAVAQRAMETLNTERFARFERLAPQLRPGAPARSSTRSILEAGYAPLFEQALGPDRDGTREGLLVVGQLRTDPLAVHLPALNAPSNRYVQRVESLLRRQLQRSPARIRRSMQLVNSAAWDTALRPDTLSRIESSRTAGASLGRVTREFLDFAVAGLLAATAPKTR